MARQNPQTRFARIGLALALAGCGASDARDAGMGDPHAQADAAGGTGAGTDDAMGGPRDGGEGDGGPGTSSNGDGGGADGSADTAGPPPDCPDGTNHEGGTRVQMRALVTAEGDRAFFDHFDVERSAPCEFNTAADGSLRCLPNNWSGSETFYLDAACTMAVYTEAEQGPCEPAGVLTVRTGESGCDSARRVLELGAELTPTSPVYVLSGGDCVEGSAPEQPLYEAGAEIPPSSFPLGEQQELERFGRVATSGITSQDGAVRVMGWNDDALDGALCHPQLNQGELHCVPAGRRLDRTNSTRFSDVSCQIPLYPHRAMECSDPPAYAIESPETGCTDDPQRVWRVGSAHAGEVYADGNACEVGTAPVDATLYGLTELASDELLGFQLRIDDTDTGRLRRRHVTSDEGGCWARTPWDSELDVACSFRRTRDDRWRCVPQGALDLSVYAGFSDESCTTPVAYAVVPACEKPAETPRFVTRTDYAGCRRVTVYEVGAPLAATPMLFYEGAGGCSPSGLPLGGALLTLTPMDPERFMPAELQ
ncbi:MAG: hypothetical protein OEZ06_04010 [Myxococcales bacterium]|nr:hypothetical protein [Myxococcales bacterium]